ncbi:DUF354 domain-containing protein [Spirosoma panaciterrae]|uniref:DUF354 domain-containing protein n=1 Tax=Spirosoma panaciterrae TaxID=496058 RepID=UPI0003618B00|nr:DUF354 domain-containing protein [Spirosoma panaciterrae]
MRFLFALGHPAHFHLYKYTISELLNEGHSVKIVISDKDILRKLLLDEKYEFEVVAALDIKNGLFFKGKKLFKSTAKLFSICRLYKPDILIGCLTQISWVGFLLRIPSIFNAEDDMTYTFLQGIITYPFISTILAPIPTKVGIFSFKKIGYAGYHKLAYLHPNRFQSNSELVTNTVGHKPYILFRLVSLNAYHDVNAKGISEETLKKLIILFKKYNIFISSEKPLKSDFQKFKLKINEKNIHHFLDNASFFIGDSQSMTVEAALLGTPNIKYNSFFGRISVLEELENVHGLTKGLPPDEDLLFKTINEYIDDSQIHSRYEEQRQIMLSSKIDVTAFFLWFYKNYPISKKIMKDNPDYQYNFR